MRGRYSGSSDDEEVGWATPGHPRGRPLEGESSEWVAPKRPGEQPRGRSLEAESSEWVATKRPGEQPRGGALETESSGTSEARSSKGSRGSQVGRLRGPGGVRHSIVVGAGDPPEAGPVVSITIHKVRQVKGVKPASCQEPLCSLEDVISCNWLRVFHSQFGTLRTRVLAGQAS